MSDKKNQERSLLKKIRLKLELIVTKFFIHVSLVLDWPWLTAVIFALITNNVNQSGEYTVLCMRRSIFMDDVRAMVKFSGRIHYLVLGRENLLQILTYFVGKEEMDKITQDNYYTHDYGKEGKEKYYQYLKKVWPIFQKFRKFDSVLYSNFCYVEEQDLARACEDVSIPLVVLFKEGMVTPGSHTQWAIKAHQGFKYGKQAKMLVYNNNIKQGMAEANIPGLVLDDMEVVGIPRMDYHFQNIINKNQQKQVVLFSAYIRDKITFLVDDDKGHEQLMAGFDKLHLLVMQFAKSHPDIKVIIKTKAYKPFLDYVVNMMSQNFDSPINNLEIINHGDPVEMMQNSQVVIGFGSTTLIEALAANKTIINFDFSSLFSHNSFDYFRDYPGLANHVNNLQELEEIILNYDKYNNVNPEGKKQFLEEFLYIPDGQASRRAENAIIKVIQEYQKK